MDRAQKADAVTELKSVFNEVGVVVVTRNLGLTVAQSTELRTKMREAGGRYKVAKNPWHFDRSGRSCQDHRRIRQDDRQVGSRRWRNGVASPGCRRREGSGIASVA